MAVAATDVDLRVRERIAIVLGAHTPTEDFVPGEIAEKVLAYLAESEPDLLVAYQTLTARDDLRVALTQISQSRRSRFYQQARGVQFAEAAKGFVDGDDSALTPFDLDYRIGDDNTRRYVRDMTGEDHRFVASQYEGDGNFKLMLAAFHQAVAKKVGKRRTEDVMSEAQYIRLYQSIVGEES